MFQFLPALLAAPASHLSCHPIVNDGKVKYVMILSITDMCAWSWGMWDRMGIVGMWTYCITVLLSCPVYCIFMSCIFSNYIACIISCIKGCGGEDETPNLPYQHVPSTPARRDAILKGDLPVCWPRGDVQIQFPVVTLFSTEFCRRLQRLLAGPTDANTEACAYLDVARACRRFYGCGMAW